jgi:hypothetical protein
MAISLFLCALVGAVANRFSGWKNVEWLPGRNIYYAAVAVFALTYLVFGLFAALAVFVSVLTYRIPGWDHSLDMGTVGDSLARDARVMFWSTLRIAPVFVFAFFFGVWVAPILLLAAAVGTVAIYYLTNHHIAKLTEDPFRYGEPLIGAWLGVLIGLALLLM